MLFFFEKLGDRIREKRKELGYTLRDLEEKSGVSYSQLSKIERGESVPSASKLTSIAYSLNLDKDILLGLAGYISEDVYAELVSKDENRYSDSNYFDAMSGINTKLLQNFEDIHKLIKDIYSYLFDKVNDNYWKLMINENQNIFGFEYERHFDEMTIEEMLFIFDIEIEIIANTRLNLEDFLNFSSIPYKKKGNILSANFKENFQKLGNKVVSSAIEMNFYDSILEEYEKISEFVRLPIYGEIKAGYGLIGEENIIGYEMAAKNKVSDGEHFYLLVKGDSMIEAGIHDGALVLIKKQDTVKEGKIGVCIIGDEATLKRVFYDGDKVILQAENKNIKPKTYDIGEVFFQGQAISVVTEL